MDKFFDMSIYYQQMKCAIREATDADVGELVRLGWEFRIEEQCDQKQAEFVVACKKWLDEVFATGCLAASTFTHRHSMGQFH